MPISDEQVAHSYAGRYSLRASVYSSADHRDPTFETAPSPVRQPATVERWRSRERDNFPELRDVVWAVGESASSSVLGQITSSPRRSASCRNTRTGIWLRYGVAKHIRVSIPWMSSCRKHAEALSLYVVGSGFDYKGRRSAGSQPVVRNDNQLWTLL